MIRLSIVIEERKGTATCEFTNESQKPSPMELAMLKNEVEHGQLKDAVVFREMAQIMLKPSSGSFMGSPAGAFVGSPAGARAAS